MSRSIDDLKPIVLQYYTMFKAKMEQAGIKYKVIQTLRTMDEQKAYYSQGREPLYEVNSLRRNAGLDPLTDKQNHKKVTWTMKSKHLTGNAFDIVLVGDKGELIWEDKTTYHFAGAIWKSISKANVWGGDFNNYDGGHFEYTGEVS